MATGLLPCGLVYGFVTLAAATGDLLHGALVMGLFGLGTAPLMIATGWGGALLSGMARARLFKAAACCVVLMGAVTLVRGLGHLRAPAESGRPVCPFCLDN
jgi:sulfite exporter TauE/SafE